MHEDVVVEDVAVIERDAIPAMRLERLAAWMIDTALYGGSAVLGGILALVYAAFGIGNWGEAAMSFDFGALLKLLLPAVGIFAAVVLGMFIIQMTLLGKRGQTLGKIVVGIRIVDVDTGEHPGALRLIGLRVVVNSIIGVVLSGVPVVGGVLSGAYILADNALILREDRRAIHDHIAGTRVDKV